MYFENVNCKFGRTRNDVMDPDITYKLSRGIIPLNRNKIKVRDMFKIVIVGRPTNAPNLIVGR